MKIRDVFQIPADGFRGFLDKRAVLGIGRIRKNRDRNLVRIKDFNLFGPAHTGKQKKVESQKKTQWLVCLV